MRGLSLNAACVIRIGTYYSKTGGVVFNVKHSTAVVYWCHTSGIIFISLRSEKLVLNSSLGVERKDVLPCLIYKT